MPDVLTIPEPACNTHPDGEDAAVRDRLMGVRALGASTLSRDEILASMKREAENGCDPLKGGAIELGLFLSADEYEELKVAARKLTIKHPKQRRRRVT